MDLKHLFQKCKLFKLSLVTIIATLCLVTFPSQIVQGTTTQITESNVTSKYLNEALSWTLEKAPNYYKRLGDSEINESLFPPQGQIVYGGLDNLGRTLTVRGTLTAYNLSQSQYISRNFKTSKKETLSGWKGNKHSYITKGVDDESYKGYFWNKSHLIAHSLGGQAIRVNAITGTRPQNVGGRSNNGGMRYTEIKAKNWLEAHPDGHLYYEAMPIYKDSELVPRAVVVSVLSSDNTVNDKVMVYNTANGYNIDYTNGTFTQQ